MSPTWPHVSQTEGSQSGDHRLITLCGIIEQPDHHCGDDHVLLSAVDINMQMWSRDVGWEWSKRSMAEYANLTSNITVLFGYGLKECQAKFRLKFKGKKDVCLPISDFILKKIRSLNVGSQFVSRWAIGRRLHTFDRKWWTFVCDGGCRMSRKWNKGTLGISVEFDISFAFIFIFFGRLLRRISDNNQCGQNF